MPMHLDNQMPAPTLVVGLDTSTPTSLRMAVIDPNAAHFPWTDELRCCRTPKTLIRHWEERFTPLSDERIAVAVNSMRHPDLLRWLQHQGVPVHAVLPHNLSIFLKDAVDHGIPRHYHVAHALANHMAVRSNPHPLLEEARIMVHHSFHCENAARINLDKIKAALAEAGDTALHDDCCDDYPF